MFFIVMTDITPTPASDRTKKLNTVNILNRIDSFDIAKIPGNMWQSAPRDLVHPPIALRAGPGARQINEAG
jgi:hypothetical protein